MGSRNYTAKSLLEACGIEPTFNLKSLINWWRSGLSGPQRGKSLNLLESIERHFELPVGHLSNLLRRSSSALFQEIKERYVSMHYVIKWHIPADFDERSESERQQIVDWLRENILPCNTEYGKYMREANLLKYALVFPTLPHSLGGHKLKSSASIRSRAVRIRRALVPISRSLPAETPLQRAIPLNPRLTEGTSQCPLSQPKTA